MTISILPSLDFRTIVTTDSDFARIPGLAIENWRQVNTPS